MVNGIVDEPAYSVEDWMAWQRQIPGTCVYLATVYPQATRWSAYSAAVLPAPVPNRRSM
jgi:hypothetical protein